MLHADVALAFQQRALSGKVCLGVHTSAMSPQLVELYGFVGVDFMIIGAEVESLDMGRMEDMIRAADAARTVPIVKLRRPDVNLIAEAMNAGAPMVMVPHITNRAQLELMVRASQFEPEGMRGECPIARYNAYGAMNLAEVHALANRSHAVIPIIEDEAALANLDEMMEVPEVDIFEIGPYDLSRALGETGKGFTGPKTMAAIERVCAAAQRHRKSVLTPIWHTRGNDSYPAVIQHQMDELISRGINCLYELEGTFLSLHMSRMSVLRQVREVVEPAPAPSPAPVKAVRPTAARAKKNGKPGKSTSVRARP